MGFDELKPVQSANEYLDNAIKKANKTAAEMKLEGDHFNKIKTKELKRIEVIQEYLTSRLNKILIQFPVMEDLTEFYGRLLDITIGKYELRHVLSNVNWARSQIKKFYGIYRTKIKYAREMNSINEAKKAYYGRVSSVIKRMDFDFLKAARKVIQDFPSIKQKYTQVAIAGFPNVGKTTLLAKLSGSKPEIAVYAFTTKKIMIGYLGEVQLLDTPGTLNRFEKMNFIEQQAFLVMELVANKIIYVFDLTEPYPLEDQKKLLKRIKEFGKPVIVYLSKTDILPKEKFEEFAKKYNAITSIEELKKLL
jgi:nucleolar GTP-binding protein